jgi:anti-anti-sigma factor
VTGAGFRVELQHDGTEWTVRCGGELDGNAALHLGDAVELCLNASPETVVMDCRDVSFVDSGGLWALLRASQEAFERRVAYSIALSEQVRDVLARAGLLERLLAGPPALSPDRT